ncbi:hypothetical protein E2C01_013858 [Portunus trituberculatus]|uniref:Uncharacterized protein n=1 Tax=Portunus trituberculatus TaxID=210409 RepID=A0A5B7DI58_PORTR|nr:hypothetical protein [Portunus trituberculatus]
MREPKSNIIEFVGTARAARGTAPPIVLPDTGHSSLPCVDPPRSHTIFTWLPQYFKHPIHLTPSTSLHKFTDETRENSQ